MTSRPPIEAGRSRLLAARPFERGANAAPLPFYSRRPIGPALPRWPLAAMFIGYPFWWALGIGDLAFPMLAVVMTAYLVRLKRVEVPAGFGIWLLFLLWMLCSVIEIDSTGRLLGFVYRGLLYLSVTLIFLYVFNARSTLSARYLTGVLTGFWLVVVAGGYLGVFFPLFSFTTPLSLIVPPGLRSNELISEMIFRRVTQFNPDAFTVLDPRPSAPFLYTNGWGNAYSMLMPFVIAYLIRVRGERRFWWILVAIPLSFVPAFLTLNRGMFLGLGIAIAYAAFRLILSGSVRALLGLVGLVAIVGIAVTVLPVEERLTSRVETSSTTEDRASLYVETFDRTLEKPLFGYGAPRPSESAGAPSAGTQGQFWMVLFSHGFVGAALFTGWLVYAFFRSWRSHGPIMLASNTALLVVVVEIFYYGIMTSGLAIAMIAAAMTMRQNSGSTRASRAQRRSLRPDRISSGN